MRKILIYAMVCFGIVANAQGRREGQNSIQGQYGYMPNKGDLGGGTVLKLEYGRVIGEKGILGRSGVFYQDYKVAYNRQLLPYQKYGVNVMAGYSYEGLYPVFLNAYIGGYAGYEIANKGVKKDTYGALIPTNVNNFTFGIVGTAEMEVILWERIGAVIDYTQYYDLKSKFSKSSYGINAGLKIYLD